jgi:translation initiation factor IF-2
LTCLSLINPKKEKKSLKLSYKPGAAGAAGAANKNKRRIALNRVQEPPGVPGAPNPIRMPNVGGGGFNANRSSRPIVREIDLLL